MKRTWMVVVGALAALAGVVVLASALMQRPKPVEWLDDNTQKVADDTYRGEGTPLVLAGQLAAAAEPRSRYVDAAGVALRYGDLTVTVTAGDQEGTSIAYVDRNGSRRRYTYGTWAASQFVPVQGFTPDGTGSTGTGTVAPTSTRRASDFRGGGPGSGK